VPSHGQKTHWIILLATLFFCTPALHAQEKSFPKPTIIPLESYGIPKGLFALDRPFLCFHDHPAGTRLFWLDTTHVFVAFTTSRPCTRRADTEPLALRALVLDISGDTSGKNTATRTWTLGDAFSLFAGPNHSVIVKQGSRLDMLNEHLQTTESGELSEKPKGLWVTPRRRTIPLLSADGHNFEFYSTDPLKQISTIALDSSSEINAVKEWIPGDERVAGSLCHDKSVFQKSVFTCAKILVLTAETNFLKPDGEPWSYAETEKPVWLQPIGFLDATHLVIARQEKGLFKNMQMFIVRPNGSKSPLPAIGSLDPSRIIGATEDGSRFGMEFTAPGNCEDCISAKIFTVTEPDSHQFLFEKEATPYLSQGELSPDGKWMAILDNGAVTLYPMP
jgi:hypothetical protein